MNYNEILKVAWKSLNSSKLRSLLTMLGVIIGVAAVIVMVSVSAGTEASIADQINGLGANLIFVQPNFSAGGMRGGASLTLNYEDAKAIAEEVNGVEGISVEQTTNQAVKVGNTSLDDVSIVGTTEDFPGVRESPVGDGRFFVETDVERTNKVAVLGFSVVAELFGETDPIGQKVTVGTTKLTVVGVMAEKGMVSGIDFDARIYTPLTVVNKYFMSSQFGRMMGDMVRLIFVQAESQGIIEDVITQIELLLVRRHELTLETADFTVTTQQDLINTQEATTESFRSLLAWVAGVSLLVGGIGIMNIMLVSVTERTREIGIRQAVGATPSDIRWQFLTEALILSLIGGLIGVLAGIGGAYIFGETGGMRTVVLPESIALAFSSAALIGIIFGFLPANKAAQLDPIEALRYE
jgi:putative ABC transport system permease protein